MNVVMTGEIEEIGLTEVTALNVVTGTTESDATGTVVETATDIATAGAALARMTEETTNTAKRLCA